MKPGETKDIAIGLQNIGTAAWEVSGAKFVSLYTYEPKYRPSLFAHPSWISSSQPTRLSTRVPVGSNGFMRLTLRAPQQAGTYKETFYLAAEDTKPVLGESKHFLRWLPKKVPPIQ